MNNSVDKCLFHVETSLPLEVSTFLHSLSTACPQSYAPAYPPSVEGVELVLHADRRHLLLLRLLNFLKTEEAEPLLSTLPTESEVFTGVHSSVAAVLAVGHFIRRYL